MAATETLVPGFLHCPEPRCPGSEQVTAALIQTIVQERYIDRGGPTENSIMDQAIENSYEYLRVSNPEDLQCPHCGRERECSLVERPVYDPLSGKDQMGLLGAKPFNPNLKIGNEDEIVTMRDDLAALREEMAELRKKAAEGDAA